MLNRCTNPKVDAYKWYGGRGIKVCERWLEFDNFIEDMGAPPKGVDLDRINRDGDYGPTNCRWVSHKENCLNTSVNRLVEWNGKSQPITKWAEDTGVPLTTIFNRLKRGYPPELVFHRGKFFRNRHRPLTPVGAK
jgi:hypothetical protein